MTRSTKFGKGLGYSELGIGDWGLRIGYEVNIYVYHYSIPCIVLIEYYLVVSRYINQI